MEVVKILEAAGTSLKQSGALVPLEWQTAASPSPRAPAVARTMERSPIPSARA